MKKWQALLLTAIILALLAVAIWLGWKPLMDLLGEKGNLIQSADSLLSILAAFGSLAAAIFSFLSARREKTVSAQPKPTTKINTGGGEFIGRDKTIQGGERSIVVDGDAIGATILHAENLFVGDVASHFLRGIKSSLAPEILQTATEAYLQYLLDLYTYLTMRGIGPAENMSLKLALLDLYVPLKARAEVPKGDTYERPLTLAGRKVQKNGGQDAQAMQEMRLGEPQPVLEILKQHGGLIILGDPGAGKTTFLKYLALKLARGEGAELGLEGRWPLMPINFRKLPLPAWTTSLLITSMITGATCPLAPCWQSLSPLEKP
jgi:hypothetical protein